MKPSELLKNWLDEQLSTHEPGFVLPSEKKLAAQFGLSVITINRLLSRYAKEGKLVRVRGKGTFIADESGTIPVQKAPDKAANSIESVYSELKNAIRNGEYKRGDALPQLKYLASRLGVNYRTVIGACKKLVADGLVHQIGKTYWVGGIKEVLANRDNREIWFFTLDPDSLSKTFINDMGFAYQKLEKEIHDNGFLIRYAPADKIGPMLRDWKKRDAMPAGMVFIRITWPTSNQLFADLKRNLPRLPTDRPPILLDLQSARYQGEVGKVNMFTRGHILTSASRALSDFILRKKYRQVVVFVRAEDFVWSVEGHALGLYRVPWIARDNDILPDFRFVISPGNNPLGTMPKIKKQIDHAIKVYSARKYNSSDEAFAQKLKDGTRAVNDYRIELKKHVDPDTLWVFDNDGHAAEAIDWARRKGISIPEDVSVIGLKHDPRFFHLGLSYCGPDWDTLGYQMAHSLIGDMPVAKTGRGFIRTRARVVEKLTTR